MSTNLDHLFNQILHSEKVVQDRKNVLNEVRAENSNVLQQIDEASETFRTLQGELILLVQRVNEKEQEERELCTAHSMLTDKFQELNQQHSQLTTNIAQEKQEMSDKLESFLASVHSFCHGYQFIGGGRHHQAMRARDELVTLQQEESRLNQEIAKLTEQQDELNKTKKEIAQYEDKIARLKQQCEETEGKHKRAEEMLKKLLAEKEEVAKFSSTNPQFIKLQEELEAASSDQTEARCKALQAELTALQSQRWKHNHSY